MDLTSNGCSPHEIVCPSTSGEEGAPLFILFSLSKITTIITLIVVRKLGVSFPNYIQGEYQNRKDLSSFPGDGGDRGVTL